MSRLDIRSARRLRKKGREKRKRTGTTFLFYYLFTYFSLSVIHLSNAADSRRNPSPRPASLFSVTGAFSPGSPGVPTVLRTLRSSLNLLQLFIHQYSRALPSTAARISNGVTRCIFDPTSHFIISRLAPRFSFCPGLPVPWQEGIGFLR